MSLPILTSCAAVPSTVVEQTVVEVPVEVPVPVDPRLTEHGDLAAPDLEVLKVLSGKDKLINITALYHYNTVRALQCFDKLDEIGALP